MFSSAEKTPVAVEQSLQSADLPVTKAQATFSANGLTNNMRVAVYLDVNALTPQVVEKVLARIGEPNLDYAYLRVTFLRPDGTSLPVYESEMSPLGFPEDYFDVGILRLPKGVAEDIAAKGGTHS